MGKLPIEHPDDGLLLRYNDGELPASKARQVKEHLETCGECRAELAELGRTLADCARYRMDVQEHLPPPPQPWPDIYREFARLDSAAGGEWLPAWILRPFRPGALRWAAAAVAAVLVLCGVYYQLRETPSVHAAALLKKAVAVADAQPKRSRRIQVRTRTRQFTRVIGAAASPAAERNQAPDIEARFLTAHYDWEDPLSAKSYVAWRDGLSGKERDEVATVPDPQSPALSCYQIRTIAAEGALASASLVLRSADMRPIEGRLEFRDREWVELIDITDTSTVRETAPVAGVEVPTGAAEPSRAAPITPGPSASISDELQVVAALHDIGADLGDPVDVSRSENRVLVTGVGVSPQRQKQIHEVLGPLPKVAVQFSEPAAAPSPAEAAPPGASQGAPASPAQASAAQVRMEKLLGGRAEFERLGSQLLDWDEAAMPRAYALRSLAQRFNAAAEANLSANDRRRLREMGREHAAAMATQVAAIQRVLVPLLVSAGGTAASRPPSARAADWQESAERLFRASRRVELLLSAMLGVTPDQGSPGASPSDLLGAIHDLEAELEECRLLLSADAGG